MLPTHDDLVDYYFHLESLKPELTKKEILKTICDSVMSLWLDIGGQPITRSGVEKKVLRLFKNISSLKKTPIFRRSRSKFPMLNCLFDVSSCICLRGLKFQKSSNVEVCSCDCKLPKELVQFIVDQRSRRHMRILNGEFVDFGQSIQIPTMEERLRQLYHANDDEDDEEATGAVNQDDDDDNGDFGDSTADLDLDNEGRERNILLTSWGTEAGKVFLSDRLYCNGGREGF